MHFILSIIMESKNSRCTTNLAQRHKFVRLWLGGNSARAIAEQTGASATTVCRWIRRWKNEGHVSLRHRRGRPRKDVRWNVFAGRTAVSSPVALWSPADFWRLRCPQPTDHRMSTSLDTCQKNKLSYIFPPYPLLCLGGILNKLGSANSGLGF